MASPITLTLQLSPEVAKRLEKMAHQQQRPLIDVAQETFDSAVLKDDLDEEAWEDTPDEEILAGLRESLEDLKAGRLIDAREALKAIREQHGD